MYGLDWWKVGRYFPHLSTPFQSSRTSLLRPQKKKKMKNPWEELKMANRNWKAIEASRMVRAAKNQESPNSDMTPTILMSRRMVFVGLCGSFERPRVSLLCFTRTITTATKTTKLNSKMTKMGPRKTPQNTPKSPMKQLWGGTHSGLQPEQKKPCLITLYTL